jgi:hypothetical protein
MNNFDFANNMRKENQSESQDSVDRRKLTHKIYIIAITLTVIALSLLDCMVRGVKVMAMF